MKWNSKKIKNKIKFKFTKLQVLIPRFWYPWISEGQFTGQSWLKMNRNIQLHVLKDWQKIEKGQGEAYIKTSYHTSHKREEEENEDDIRFVLTQSCTPNKFTAMLMTEFVLPELPTPPKKWSDVTISVFLRKMVYAWVIWELEVEGESEEGLSECPKL